MPRISSQSSARSAKGRTAKVRPLSKKQVRYLRSLAHALKPLVRIGQHGLTPAVTAELERTLDHHELVKVKLSADGRDARNAQLEALSGAARAAVVQRIGHTATLFRANPDNPLIDLQAHR